MKMPGSKTVEEIKYQSFVVDAGGRRIRVEVEIDPQAIAEEVVREFGNSPFVSIGAPRRGVRVSVNNYA